MNHIRIYRKIIFLAALFCFFSVEEKGFSESLPVKKYKQMFGEYLSTNWGWSFCVMGIGGAGFCAHRYYEKNHMKFPAKISPEVVGFGLCSLVSFALGFWSAYKEGVFGGQFGQVREISQHIRTLEKSARAGAVVYPGVGDGFIEAKNKRACEMKLLFSSPEDRVTKREILGNIENNFELDFAKLVAKAKNNPLPFDSNAAVKDMREGVKEVVRTAGMGKILDFVGDLSRVATEKK
jgi:hypothetical protein